MKLPEPSLKILLSNPPEGTTNNILGAALQLLDNVLLATLRLPKIVHQYYASNRECSRIPAIWWSGLVVPIPTLPLLSTVTTSFPSLTSLDVHSLNLSLSLLSIPNDQSLPANKYM